MKPIYVYIIAIILFPVSVLSQNQTLVQKADSAYNKDNFTEALKLYMDAARTEGTSTGLYYNIGNSYYRLGNIRKAVVYYERALLLDPNNQDAKDNLDFLSTKIVDIKSGSEQNILVEAIDSLISSKSSDTWATIAIICFILFVGAVMVYIFSPVVVLRKIGFFGGFILLVAVIITNIFAFKMRNIAERHDYAVITVPSVTLSTSPRVPKDKSEEAFILNEGTKVRILDSVMNTIDSIPDKWYDVKIDNAHRAWINSKNIEII